MRALMYGAAILLMGTAAQHIGKAKPEEHLKMPVQECSMVAGKPTCHFLNTTAVLDSNWRCRVPRASDLPCSPLPALLGRTRTR